MTVFNEKIDHFQKESQTGSDTAEKFQLTIPFWPENLPYKAHVKTAGVLHEILEYSWSNPIIAYFFLIRCAFNCMTKQFLSQYPNHEILKM